jgi:catalase
MATNETKAAEYGHAHAIAPSAGTSTEMPPHTAGAGTLSERNQSAKTGPAPLEPVCAGASLDRVRVNLTDQVLTTNQGVPVSNNQNSLLLKSSRKIPRAESP